MNYHYQSFQILYQQRQVIIQQKRLEKYQRAPSPRSIVISPDETIAVCILANLKHCNNNTKKNQ